MLGIVILVGGRGSRLGGVFKPGLRRDGVSLLARLLGEVALLRAEIIADAAAAGVVGVAPVVLVQGVAGAQVLGDEAARVPAWVRFGCDGVAGAGPVQGLRDAVADAEMLKCSEVLVLAGDLATVQVGALRALVQPLDAGVAVRVARDVSGRVQFLLAMWNTSVLLGRLEGAFSFREVYELTGTGHTAQLHDLPLDATQDIDEPGDAAALGIDVG